MREKTVMPLRIFRDSSAGEVAFKLNTSWGRKRRTSRQTPTTRMMPKKEK